MATSFERARFGERWRCFANTLMEDLQTRQHATKRDSTSAEQDHSELDDGAPLDW